MITGWVWWYKPVISATREEKVGGSQSQASPSKVSGTISKKQTKSRRAENVA
jgi:hypothetical protein